MEERELHDAITAYIHTYIHALLQTHRQRDTHSRQAPGSAARGVAHKLAHTGTDMQVSVQTGIMSQTRHRRVFFDSPQTGGRK